MVWADSDKESDTSKAKFGNWEIEFARVVLGRPLPDGFGSALLSRCRTSRPTIWTIRARKDSASGESRPRATHSTESQCHRYPPR